jgi:protein-S-isoprenylcysteine O-methyltransferase Ste14
MQLLLAFFWCAWAYPFVFRAPLRQKRASITVSGPTYAGLFFEVSAIFLAFAVPPVAPDLPRLCAASVFAILAAVLSWTSVRHLGKQFRLRAGLYEGHELIRTGPYAVVRHPIYSSLMAILLCTLLWRAPWLWMLPSLALFILGTEIRVHTEDKLLASRFGAEFVDYRRAVSAYVPFLR